MRRYSLGVKIDCLFSDVIELIATAQFAPKSERILPISRAIARNDVLKFMLYAMLELKGIEEEHFIVLTPKLEEIGRILYGWRQHSEKENHPTTALAAERKPKE